MSEIIHPSEAPLSKMLRFTRPSVDVTLNLVGRKPVEVGKMEELAVSEHSGRLAITARMSVTQDEFARGDRYYADVAERLLIPEATDARRSLPERVSRINDLLEDQMTELSVSAYFYKDWNSLSMEAGRPYLRTGSDTPFDIQWHLGADPQRLVATLPIDFTLDHPVFQAATVLGLNGACFAQRCIHERHTLLTSHVEPEIVRPVYLIEVAVNESGELVEVSVENSKPHPGLLEFGYLFEDGIVCLFGDDTGTPDRIQVSSFLLTEGFIGDENPFIALRGTGVALERLVTLIRMGIAKAKSSADGGEAVEIAAANDNDEHEA